MMSSILDTSLTLLIRLRKTNVVEIDSLVKSNTPCCSQTTGKAKKPKSPYVQILITYTQQHTSTYLFAQDKYVVLLTFNLQLNNTAYCFLNLHSVVTGF